MTALLPSSRRFRITDIMVLTVSAAFAAALSNVGIKSWRWYDVGIAIVTGQFCIGLIQQSFSIFRMTRPIAVGRLTAEERWGVRFAILLRVILIFGLLAYYVCRVAKSNGFNVFDGDERVYFSNFYTDCHAISILLTLLLNRRTKKTSNDRRTKSRMQIVVDCLGLLMGLAMVIWVAIDRTIITGLVNCALTGMGAAMNIPFEQGSFPSSYFVDCRNLLIAGSIGTALAVYNVVCFRTWLKKESKTDRRIVLLWLIFGLTASTGIAAWIHRVGLPRLSPWLFSDYEWPSTNRMIFAVLAVLLTGAYFALPRLCSEVHEPSRLSHINSTRFADEWIIVRLTLLVCSIGYLYVLISYDGGVFAFISGPSTFLEQVGFGVQNIFFSPLRFAVALAVSADILQTLLGLDGDKFISLSAVKPFRLAMAVIAGFLGLLTGAVSLTCLGFALNVFPQRLWFGL